MQYGISSTISLEENMFSTIDSRVIGGLQWFVRQLELYTFLTRRMVLMALLLVVMGLVVTRTCVGIQLTGLMDPLGSWIAFGFFATLPYFLSVYDLAKGKSVYGFLPKEIVTRCFHRGMSAGLVFGTLLFYLGWRGFEIRDQTDFLSYFCVKIIFWESIVFWLVEYFLCTTSLPPGEKEKKKQERGMGNTSPALA
jgi:hypothetical protein